LLKELATLVDDNELSIFTATNTSLLVIFSYNYAV